MSGISAGSQAEAIKTKKELMLMLKGDKKDTTKTHLLYSAVFHNGMPHSHWDGH